MAAVELRPAEMRAVDALLPYARNSKKHSPAQIQVIVGSIERFGWTNPCLVADGILLAGHGRIMAAKKMGLARVPCIDLSDLSDDERRAYVIMDNRSAEHPGATWDLDMLKLETDDLRAMGLDVEAWTGFAEADLANLFEGMETPEPEGSGDPDEVPEVPEVPHSRPGDIWVLGNHRLACGDCSDPALIAALMGELEADLCVTDPPYNVAYESKLAGKIKNDNMADAEFRRMLRGWYDSLFAAMKPGAPIYVAHADTEGLNFRTEFRDAGFKLSGCLIWRKNSLVLGRSDYQWQHEPILYGWKPGAAHRWYGGRKRTTVVEYADTGGAVVRREDGSFVVQAGDRVLVISGDAFVEEIPSSVICHDKPSRSELHPTTKPVGLWEKLMKPSSRPGNVVIDWFSGSGTTVIAAERMGLVARVAEIDPRFADVGVRRWEMFTGLRATHAVSGEYFPADGETRAPAGEAVEADDQPF